MSEFLQLDLFGKTAPGVDGEDKSISIWISEVRKEFHGRLQEGESLDCPCCDSFCKVYKRKLNSSMAKYMIEIMKAFHKTGDWVHVPGLPIYSSESQRGDYSYLRHWGLLEQKPNDKNPEKKDSGVWRPTEKGVSFSMSWTTVPTHIYLYNNTLLRLSDEMIDIKTALGNKFDYSELMNEVIESVTKE